MDPGHQPVSGLGPISHPHKNAIATKVILLFRKEEGKTPHTPCCVVALNATERTFFHTLQLVPLTSPGRSFFSGKSQAWDNHLFKLLQAVCPSQETSRRTVPGKAGVAAVFTPQPPSWRQGGRRGQLETGQPPGVTPNGPLSLSP